MEREILQKLIEEQKFERHNQLELIKNLKALYDKWNKEGYEPNSLLELIATWEGNLEIVEKNIKELDQSLKDRSSNG